MLYAKLSKQGFLLNGICRPELVGVVVGISPFKRRYFDGTYKPGNTDAPVCFATDGKPDPDAPEKQAESCKVCPMRKGKCRAFRELVLVSKEFGIVQLHLPAASLIPFTQYASDINMPINRVATKVELDPAFDYIRAKFSKVGTLTNESADKILAYARAEGAPYMETSVVPSVPALPFDFVEETAEPAAPTETIVASLKAQFK
jgi:hypothetical protein